MESGGWQFPRTTAEAAVEVQALPPRVIAADINDGAVQRSLVTNLRITFSEPVTTPAGLAAALSLQRTGPSNPIGFVNLDPLKTGNIVTITFVQGWVVDIDPGGSLQDGLYQLTIVASKIAGLGGLLDGNGNGVGGDNRVQSLHRLFGDADGDRDVDAGDFGAFRAAFGGPSIAFAFDNDGDVDAEDFGEIRAVRG